jgi:hypothetical protein
MNSQKRGIRAAFGILDEELEKLIGHKCTIKRKNPVPAPAA